MPRARRRRDVVTSSLARGIRTRRARFVATRAHRTAPTPRMMFTTARARATPRAGVVAPARATARRAVTCANARATGRTTTGSVRASATTTATMMMRAGAGAGAGAGASPRGLVRTVGASASPLAMPTYDGYDGPVKDKNEPIRVKIGDEWYDCRGWAKAHPGGERWLYFFDGRDATDVFYALHSYGPNGSDLAVKRLSKLPRCDPPVDRANFRMSDRTR